MSPHLVGNHRAKQLPLGEDRGWKTVGSMVVVKLLNLHGWCARENKSLEMRLQLYLWRRKSVLLCPPPTVLGCSIRVFLIWWLWNVLQALFKKRKKGVEVWGWGCYSLYYCSNYSFVFFWTLSVLKLCLSSCCASLFLLGISLSLCMLPFFPFPSLSSPVVLTPTSSCVYFSLPLCQFRSVILSF